MVGLLRASRGKGTNVTKASPTDQRRLLELQATDTAIRQLRYRRANLDEQRALDDNADLLDRLTADHMASRDELVALDRQQKRLENDINTVDSRRKAEEARMYSGVIASEREVQAIRSELTTLKGRKQSLEDELLEVMERQEELTSTVQTLESRRKEVEAQVPPLEQARNAAAGDIDSELGVRQATREDLARQLPGDLVRRYDELRSRKDGVAVVELRDGTCQGCFLELSPGELEEGRELGIYGMARCVQCGRLLVEPVRG
jgi:uncharacterized protein